MASNRRAWSDLLKTLLERFELPYVAGSLRPRCKPFFIEQHQVGLVREDAEQQLEDYPHIFLIDQDKVLLNPALQSYEDRSTTVAEVLQELRLKNVLVTLTGWRDECYEVRTNFGEVPLMKMERSATCLFGIKKYGVDINGYVRDPEKGVSIWIQQRAFTKQTWPGKLDNMVSGGIAVGFGPIETMMKEAQEEASIPDHLLSRITPAGTVTFYYEDERGLLPETEFVFDIELPLDFEPANSDGEVEGFKLMTIEEVKEVVVSPAFKTTSVLVTLDFLVRHGFLVPEEEPNYWYLAERLHMPLHNVYSSPQSAKPKILQNGLT